MSMAEPPPHTNVVALLVHPDGRYLLHLRDANKPISSAGQWSLPGGYPEPGESLDAAIARELLEEADLRIADLAPFALVEDTEPDGRLTGRVQVYAGTWRGDPAAVPLTEGIMLRWTDPGQLPWLTIDPMTSAVIAHHRSTLGAGPPSGAPLPVLRVRAPGTRTVANVVGVHLYAERDGRVLLGLRHPDSPYAPSHHHFLAGHCEQESAIACLVREAREEAGLDIAADNVEFVHAVHVLDAPGTQPRMQLVFRARAWSGEPRVMEPDKCVSWDWWPLDALPDPTVTYTRAAIDGIRRGRLYTETGWV
ncbi:NUDIX domain-containing protein [Streptomyces sp. NPDC091215]|uniref:NUDIX hydrolase n=1 Tax=Streptomyces sp. NPDC091215 TaxID=3155192 RepID=UPI00342C343B